MQEKNIIRIEKENIKLKNIEGREFVLKNEFSTIFSSSKLELNILILDLVFVVNKKSSIEKNFQDLKTKYFEKTELINVLSGKFNQDVNKGLLNKENLDQKMGKSSKSIFYGLKDKALQEQNGILKGIQAAKDQIQKAAESMSDVDKQQLIKALSQLNEIKDSSKESSEKQKAEEIKSALDEMGGANTPQFLKDTIKLAEQIKDSPTGKGTGITADQLLMEAMNLIEKKLKSMEMKDQVRKKMNQQMPPDVYKKMVEEYFQNLNKKSQ
jgi:hypothetical protein